MDVNNSAFCSQISVRSQNFDTLQPEMILQFGKQVIRGRESSNHEDDLYVRLWAMQIQLHWNVL